jgi:hypothetical protein
MSWAATALRLASVTMRALGNEVTIGGTNGWGILQSPSESVFDGVVIWTDWVVELPVATWPTVAEGAVITVDGTTFRAREQGRIGKDGSVVMVPLEEYQVPLATMTTIGGDTLITQNGLELVAV